MAPDIERGSAMRVGPEMEAIFGSTGQAVHLAFVVMSQPAMQDAPMRKALIRVLESIRLADEQRAWLDQLRGQPSESVNFGGLSGDEVRAQCAMITQAVKQLPKPEMWALQAKYGHVEFEDMTPADLTGAQLADALDRATKEVETSTAKMRQARLALDASREQYLATQGRISGADVETSIRNQYEAARDDVRDAGGELARAEAAARAVQIAIDRAKGGLIDSGKAAGGESRRFAFSAERIEAIKGLSDWFRPSFPRIKPLAIDCMLGRLFANHAKVGISFRDLAESFGGNAMAYQRASFKMQNHLRQLEQLAMQHLEIRFVNDGVALPTESD
jgi:hypothetical protein